MDNRYTIRTLAQLAISNARHARYFRKTFGTIGEKSAVKYDVRRQTFMEAARIITGTTPAPARKKYGWAA